MTSAVAPRRKSGAKARYALVVLAFLLPSAVPLAAFVLAPMVAAAWVSLTEWNLIRPAEFVGLANYVQLLTDPETLIVNLMPPVVQDLGETPETDDDVEGTSEGATAADADADAVITDADEQ